MNNNTYLWLSALIFLIVAVVHLVRAIAGWPIMVGGTSLPVFGSWIAFIIAGLMSWFGFNLSGKM